MRHTDTNMLFGAKVLGGLINDPVLRQHDAVIVAEADPRARTAGQGMSWMDRIGKTLA